MAWTNGVAALAIGGLGAYVFTQASTLADDEQHVFGYGDRLRRLRRQSHRFGGAFLLACAVATFMAGIG